MLVLQGLQRRLDGRTIDRFALVRLVQLRQVLGDVFLQLLLLALELLEVEVLARRGE
jgi:hypothetical protein